MSYQQPYGGGAPQQYGQQSGYPGQHPPHQPPYPQQPNYNHPQSGQYNPPPNQYGQQGYNQPPSGQYNAPPAPYGQPSYGQPPPGQYNPPPGQPGQYAAPPAQYGQNNYGQPPPGQYSAPPAQYGQAQYGGTAHYSNAPPPQNSYGPPPSAQYATPAYVQPTPPSLGYASSPPNIQYDAVADADALRKAMKGLGTDEKRLIQVLAQKDPLQIAVIRQTYNYRHSRNLANDVASEVSGYFEEGLLAIIRGPLHQDCHILRAAMSGPGTKEAILNDVLLSRSNADINAIKAAYHQTYHRSLEGDVKGDLSMKTERHFLMVLAATRAEDSAPVIPQQIDHDTQEIYKATEGKIGTDELLVCDILSHRNDAQIRAIAQTYKQRYSKDLESVIRKEFSGHMEKALLHQLRGGTDKIMRDAMLLEDAMAGVGTEDRLLVNRVVRYHWDRNYMAQVKAAYYHRYRHPLSDRIRGETSGDYERLMLACIGD